MFTLTTTQFLIFLLLSNYFSVFCIVFYLHKYRSHNQIIMYPFLSHVCSFWLWLTTGINSKIWSLIHLDHHRFPDTDKDVHSLARYGAFKILTKGILFYFQKEVQLLKDGVSYEGYTTIEKHLYFRYRKTGFIIYFFIITSLFGPWYALVASMVHFFCAMFLFANVFNYLSHRIGYKNFKTEMKQSRTGETSIATATNIFPIGIVLFGEELHNNHHTSPNKVSNRVRFFEFDFGYVVALIFEKLNLIKINR